MRKLKQVDIVSLNKHPQPNRVTKKVEKLLILLVIVLFFSDIYVLGAISRSIKDINFSRLGVFNTIFASILMQAFPFLLIGVFVSSAMQIFVPDEFIVKIFPTKHGLGYITAMFAGLFFPVCECAIVPVMTRLVKKGVPVSVAVTFMLSAPIINPIVIASTLTAFPGQPGITLVRVSLGLTIALIIGLFLQFSPRKQSVLLNIQNRDVFCDCEQTYANGYVCDQDDRIILAKTGFSEKLKQLFLHSGEEFFNVGKYLVIGAFLTSLIQTLVPKDAFVSLASQNGLSLLFMMLAAFLFSACSTSDAFIARSFMNQLSLGAIMGFMVFGPMMDLKNLLMLLGNFRKSFVFMLTGLIVVVNFLLLFMFSFLIA